MEKPMMRVKKILRRAGALLLHFFIAVFGVAVIITAIYIPLSHFFPPQTINSVVARGYFLSILIAALVGFFVYRSWKAEAAKWVGIIGISLFVSRAASGLASSQGGIWFQMLGGACREGNRATGCINYLTFTTTAVRTVCYSVGAWLAWYFKASGNSEIGRSVFAVFRNPFLPSNPEDSTSNDLPD
ncbi:MAG TPA: hypothetical protein VFL96_03475 [Acidobacteriaceae bacterium]|nr:hypothetical protein [Acidobacteriaceae bacterium]